MRRPFYALTVTSVLAGLVAGILGLHSYGYGSQSIPGLLLFLGNGATMDWPNFYNALIVFAVIAVLSFVTVWAFGFDDSVYDEDEAEEEAEAHAAPAAPEQRSLPTADLSLSLPGGEERKLILCQKLRFTPKGYPRHGGTILKHPL